MSSAEKQVRINEEITSPQLRLVGAKGEQIGIVTNKQAQQLALESSFDLVEIAPNANPPVCRLMDYRKFLFEQAKQKAAAKKRQKKTLVKEMTFRPNTGKADYEVKLKKILAFLEHGDKVKITLRYRGREMSHHELGLQLVETIKTDLEPYSSIEQMPKFEGRQIIMMVAPAKKK